MAIVMSLDLFKLRKMFGTIEELLYLLTKVEEDKLVWHACFGPFFKRIVEIAHDAQYCYEDDSTKGSIGLWMWNMVGPSIKIAEAFLG